MNAPLARGQQPDWAENARRIHARFRGKPGTLALFGDSITFSQAFWTPLRGNRRNASPDLERAIRRAEAHLLPECWREWRGPEFGNESGKTLAWADANVGDWLRRLNPQAAVILFGTNDLPDTSPTDYRDRLRSLARRCLDNGTIVLLTTVPPRHGFEKAAERFAAAAREVARELQLPLIDYHAEILKRRPQDWDGASDRFKEYDGYEVPTLISRDGVHPSFPARYQGDYSEEALSRSGCTLRNYLTVLRYEELLDVLEGRRLLPPAPPLPRPTGAVHRVSDTASLVAAATAARPGDTILLADGLYALERTVDFRTDRLTVRGASGNRDRVILDGAGVLGEGLRVNGCVGVTIADLTVQNIRWNGVKIDSDSGVQQFRLYNCVLRNIWQRAVKGVIVPERDRDRLRPRDCVIERCLFVNDRPKRFEDDPADTAATFGGDYIAGIDVMFPTRWVIRDNEFHGIRGRTGQGRGAIFLWHDVRDCVVERNVIVDCDAGISLGNASRADGVPIHATGCVVRNNFITRAPEGGLFAAYTRDCRILHNTVYDAESRLGRGVRVAFDTERLLIANNLLSGVRVLVETGGRDGGVTLRGNRERMSVGLFADPASGDLHLVGSASGVTDAAERETDAIEDIDRHPRGQRTDIGAHEFGSA
jgi:hypothetical protein